MRKFTSQSPALYQRSKDESYASNFYWTVHGKTIIFRSSSTIYHSSRNSSHNRVWRNIFSDDGPGSYDAARAHMHTIQKSHIRANPAIIVNHNTFPSDTLVSNRTIHEFKVVVFRVKTNMLAHDDAIADPHSASRTDK